MSFVHHHTVRFAEVDPAGILFFSRVAEHCHAAYEATVAAAGIAIPAYFGGSPWKAPIVRWEVDYHAPSRLGETLTIELRILEYGRTSITFGFRVAGPDTQLRAQAKMIAVFVEGEPLRARPIPDHVLAAFAKVPGLPAPKP